MEKICYAPSRLLLLDRLELLLKTDSYEQLRIAGLRRMNNRELRVYLCRRPAGKAGYSLGIRTQTS